MAGASEQLQEEERDNAADKAGFLSFTEALINLAHTPLREIN